MVSISDILAPKVQIISPFILEARVLVVQTIKFVLFVELILPFSLIASHSPFISKVLSKIKEYAFLLLLKLCCPKKLNNLKRHQKSYSFDTSRSFIVETSTKIDGHGNKNLDILIPMDLS